MFYFLLTIIQFSQWSFWSVLYTNITKYCRLNLNCHNTLMKVWNEAIMPAHSYLAKDQLRGPSKVEMYIKALQKGCRCVECKTRPVIIVLGRVHMGFLTPFTSLMCLFQLLSSMHTLKLLLVKTLFSLCFYTLHSTLYVFSVIILNVLACFE